MNAVGQPVDADRPGPPGPPGRRRWHRSAPFVVAAGAVAGAVGRDLPVELAIVLIRRKTPPCNDRSILECALDNIDDVLAGLMRFFFALVAICVVAGIIGLVLVVVGAVRRRAWLVGIGVAVLVPVIWQAAFVAWHLLTA